jgi:hypothetical protein
MAVASKAELPSKVDEESAVSRMAAMRPGTSDSVKLPVEKVLRRSKNAGRDVAARNDGLLRARENHVDTGCAEATADGRIIAFGAGQVGDGPLEGLGMLPDQEHAVDAEAWGLGVGDALNRGRWGGLGALVDGALVLLSQGAFAFLLALLLDEGLWCAGNTFNGHPFELIIKKLFVVEENLHI